MRRYFISILLQALVLAALVGAAFATASSIGIEPPGALEARFHVGYKPMALPAQRRAPVSFALSERIATPDGSHPAALRELVFDLDRHLGPSVKGLPSCPPPFGGRQPRTPTLEKCEEARIGTGTFEVEVAFPEQQPVRITGGLSVYNGGVEDGRTIFWLYVLLPAPVTGVVLVPLEVRRVSHGIYGWTGKVKLPKIANGAGSMTHLEARFRKGVFSAGCGAGKLQFGATADFADGTRLGNAVSRTCRKAASSGRDLAG